MIAPSSLPAEEVYNSCEIAVDIYIIIQYVCCYVFWIDNFIHMLQYDSNFFLPY